MLGFGVAAQTRPAAFGLVETGTFGLNATETGARKLGDNIGRTSRAIAGCCFQLEAFHEVVLQHV